MQSEPNSGLKITHQQACEVEGANQDERRQIAEAVVPLGGFSGAVLRLGFL
jgi:hypothetical protein